MIVFMIQYVEQNVGARQSTVSDSPDLCFILHGAIGQEVEIGIGGGADCLVISIEALPI